MVHQCLAPVVTGVAPQFCFPRGRCRICDGLLGSRVMLPLKMRYPRLGCGEAQGLYDRIPLRWQYAQRRTWVPPVRRPIPNPSRFSYLSPNPPLAKIAPHPQFPTMNSGYFDYPAYDQLHELRKQRGCRRKDSKAALKQRLASMHDQDLSRARAVEGKTVNSVTEVGQQGRPISDVVEASHDPVGYSGSAG